MIPYWVYAYVILLLTATAATAGFCIGTHLARQKLAAERGDKHADHRKLHAD